MKRDTENDLVDAAQQTVALNLKPYIPERQALSDLDNLVDTVFAYKRNKSRQSKK